MCLSAVLQDTGPAQDALHQAEERLKGLQAAYEQEKGKAEVRPSCCPGMCFLQCHILSRQHAHGTRTHLCWMSRRRGASWRR